MGAVIQQTHFGNIGIIGADTGLARVMDQAAQVARTDTHVILFGETGVGKGVIASLIHELSLRNTGPFVSVNCGAIPETLVDSELFGHERGAFTGAALRKQGRFERAHGGTIFLDEIGELPPPAQVRLLNVLQNHEIERVGGTQVLPVDIRVISATHRDLEAMVAKGSFRKDLWFRLNVFPIHVPPLRHRREDIPRLVEHFIRRKGEKLRLAHLPEMSSRSMEQLMDYHWPGNVRELENIVERAMICCKNGTLNINGILQPRKPITHLGSPHRSECQSNGHFLSLDQVTRIHINKALVSAKGKINGPGGAAQLLSVHPNTLRKRMDRLGIRYGKKRISVMGR